MYHSLPKWFLQGAELEVGVVLEVEAVLQVETALHCRIFVNQGA
jgi:hypothetical protein